MAGAKTLMLNGIAQGDLDMSGFDILNAGNISGGSGGFADVPAHYTLIGPTVGGVDTPDFRLLIASDLPAGTMQGANNLAEIVSPSSARTALGLTTVATAASTSTGRTILNIGTTPSLEGVNFLTTTDGIPGWTIPASVLTTIGAEPALPANPVTSGFVLATTNGGVRSWAQRLTLTGTEVITNKTVNGLNLRVTTAAAGDAVPDADTGTPASPFTFRLVAVSPQTTTSVNFRTTAATDLILPTGPGTVALVGTTLPSSYLSTSPDMKPGSDVLIPSQRAVLRFVNARTSSGVLDTSDDTRASASTVNLDTTTGYQVDITGTTTINAFTLANGEERLLRFTGITTLVNSSTLLLPGGINITTAAGHIAVVKGFSGSVVKMIRYETGSVGANDGQRLSVYGGKIQQLSSFEFAPAVPTSRTYLTLDLGGDAAPENWIDLSAGSVTGLKSRLAGGGTGTSKRLTAADLYCIVTSDTIGGSGATASGADTLVVTTDTDANASVNRLRGIVNNMFADGPVDDAIVLVNAIDNTLRTVGGLAQINSGIVQSNTIIAAPGGYVNNPILFKGGMGNGGLSGLLTGTAKGVSLESWTGAPTTSYGIYMDSSIGIGTTSWALYSLSVAPSLMTGQLQLGAGGNGRAPLKFTSAALLGTAQEGGIEFLDDAYYGTTKTDARRKRFAFADENTTTTAAAGTTTLTVSSTPMQTFVGTTTQTVMMPLASTLPIGTTFTIVSYCSPATGSDDGGVTTEVTVKNAAGTTLIKIPGITVAQSTARRPSVAIFKTIGTSTSIGSWSVIPLFLSTDAGLGSLVPASDTKAASQLAIKTYVDARLPGGAAAPLSTTPDNTVATDVSGTLDLTTHDGVLIDITGTDDIDTIVLAEGREVVLRFADELDIINGATLVTPGATVATTAATGNVTTETDGYVVARGGSAGVVNILKYQTSGGYSDHQFKNIYMESGGNITFRDDAASFFDIGNGGFDPADAFLRFRGGTVIQIVKTDLSGSVDLDVSALDASRSFSFPNHAGTFQMRVAAPAAAGSDGEAGQFAYDSGFLYMCVATDTWKRVAIATWP